MYSGRRHDAACMRLAHAEDLLLQVLLISHTFLSLQGVSKKSRHSWETKTLGTSYPETTNL